MHKNEEKEVNKMYVRKNKNLIEGEKWIMK